MMSAEQTTFVALLVCMALLVATSNVHAAAAGPGPAGPAPLEITQDTVLDAAKTYGPIVIKASGITVDGRGAWVVGATEGEPTTFKGTGISAQGVSRVTLKGVNAKGWNVGLKVQDGGEWVIENCNFSDNYHNPEHGWGDLGRRGGMVLEHVKGSTLRGNKANRVWNGCVLADSDDNVVENNDLSHTSDTCLSLWTACRNVIRKNNLSYGLRIKQGEVHARDSVCLMVESGSNDNKILDNDITHGGDGVFIRSLNGWTSSGNVFERNDASYAHNNCFEAQSPGNTYRGNKGNHGSYGFWLGMSDKTVLEDNEASYNGEPDGHHNAPFLAKEHGHAGIIFVGPSSHSVARGNKCVGNNGAGIAILGDNSPKKAYTAFHWVLERNVVRDNYWGLYLQCADFIDLAANTIQGNAGGDRKDVGFATNVTEHAADPAITRPPQAKLAGPSSGAVGQEIVLDASGSTDPAGKALAFRWDLGDGTVATAGRVAHAFKAPGFYRVGVTVTNGSFCDLAWRDFRVASAGPEWGTEGQAGNWAWEEVHPREGLHLPGGKPAKDVPPARLVEKPTSKVRLVDDPNSRVAGKSALAVHVLPSGNPIRLIYPASKAAGIALAGKTHLAFWCKMHTGNIHAWKGFMPTVTVYESDTKFATIRPWDDARNWPHINECRADWTYLTIPLAGDEQWKLQGELPATLNYIAIEFYPWGSMPTDVWLDDMTLK
jgi:parallel beta-helix repeat protein